MADSGKLGGIFIEYAGVAPTADAEGRVASEFLEVVATEATADLQGRVASQFLEVAATDIEVDTSYVFCGFIEAFVIPRRLSPKRPTEPQREVQGFLQGQNNIQGWKRR